MYVCMYVCSMYVCMYVCTWIYNYSTFKSTHYIIIYIYICHKYIHISSSGFRNKLELYTMQVYIYIYIVCNILY